MTGLAGERCEGVALIALLENQSDNPRGSGQRPDSPKGLDGFGNPFALAHGVLAFDGNDV